MSMLHTLCLTCNVNHTVPVPPDGWESTTMIPCPTCGEPLSILGLALGVVVVVEDA